MPPLDPLSLPHHTLRQLLAEGAPVYVPVNPVEYHGPHLSLHNDRLISAGIIRDLAEGQAHPLVIPDLEVGVDPVPGPGSRATSFRTVRDLTWRACASLAELGARRIVLVTFHGAPLHARALQDVIVRLGRGGVRAINPLNLLMQDLLDGDIGPWTPAFDSIPDPMDRAAALADLSGDFHAGCFETSVALHYAPDSVHSAYGSLPPCPEVHVPAWAGALVGAAKRLGRHRFAAELGFAGLGVAWYHHRPFCGYTGRPHLARPEIGAWFARAMVARFVPRVRAVLEGEEAPPAPILSWLGPLTLGGWIPGPSVAANERTAPPRWR